MNIIIVDFIKIRNKNLVNKANLWLALCMFKISPKIRLDYADKYISRTLATLSTSDGTA